MLTAQFRQLSSYSPTGTSGVFSFRLRTNNDHIVYVEPQDGAVRYHDVKDHQGNFFVFWDMRTSSFYSQVPRSGDLVVIYCYNLQRALSSASGSLFADFVPIGVPWVAGRDSIKNDIVWQVEGMEDGKGVALKSHSLQKYLCKEITRFVVNRARAGNWEKFFLEDMGNIQINPSPMNGPPHLQLPQNNTQMRDITAHHPPSPQTPSPPTPGYYPHHNCPTCGAHSPAQPSPIMKQPMQTPPNTRGAFTHALASSAPAMMTYTQAPMVTHTLHPGPVVGPMVAVPQVTAPMMAVTQTRAVPIVPVHPRPVMAAAPVHVVPIAASPVMNWVGRS